MPNSSSFNRLVKSKYGFCLYNQNDIYIGKSIEEYGEFSSLESDLFGEFCKSGDVVIEVGSNIGTHTQILSKLVQNGIVFAFEPQRLVYQTLCANLALNSITNVFAYNEAVSSDAGKILVPELEFHKKNNFGGISLNNTKNGIWVNQIKLDQFNDGIKKLSFLKIDVEGMEVDVLNGAKELINKFSPTIYLENDRKEKSKELIELIWFMGYKIYWHLPPLYNPDNFFKNSNNIFDNLVSVNMLCTKEDLTFDSKKYGLFEVEDSNYHPMQKEVKKVSKEHQEMLEKSLEAYRKNDYKKAIEISNEMIKKDFVNVETYYNLGTLYTKTLQWQNAVNAYQEALNIDPTFIKTYQSFGALLKNLKMYKEAIELYVIALKYYPKDYNIHNNIGMIFELQGDTDKAIEAYKNAVRINPKFAKAVNNIAVVLYKQKKYKESSDMFELALNIEPTYYEVYSNLGAALNRQKRYDESITALEMSIKKLPKSSGGYTNLGNVYSKLYDYKKAQKLHEKAILLDPTGSNAYANLGSTLKNQGLLKKAVDNYKKAIENEPDFVNAHFDLSTALLTLGEFKVGFSEYEWRFKKDEMIPHIIKYKDIFSKPMLAKETNAKGKTVLIHSEQGFGDSIMFARLIPKIKEKFACKIIFKARDEIVTLLENNCAIDEVTYRSKQTPEFDFHLPIMSAAYVLGLEKFEDFSSKAYIKVDDKDESLLVKKTNKKPNIGICWSASVTGESYDGKVFDLKYFDDLINSESFNVYSFQVGEGSSDIKKYGYENKIIDLTEHLTDFKKSAIFAQELDLVITSDTSVAHLCGALGVKTWTLLQKFPDWRWKNKGEKSYMYDSMKLFRQKHDRNWETIFQSLNNKIQKEFKVKL